MEALEVRAPLPEHVNSENVPNFPEESTKRLAGTLILNKIGGKAYHLESLAKLSPKDALAIQKTTDFLSSCDKWTSQKAIATALPGMLSVVNISSTTRTPLELQGLWTQQFCSIVNDKMQAIFAAFDAHSQRDWKRIKKIGESWFKQYYASQENARQINKTYGAFAEFLLYNWMLALANHGDWKEMEQIELRYGALLPTNHNTYSLGVSLLKAMSDE